MTRSNKPGLGSSKLSLAAKKRIHAAGGNARFGQDPEEARRQGRKGGRARAENLRTRRLLGF